MPNNKEFTAEYTLNKAFFAECYDQTSTPTEFPKSYYKAALFLLFGSVLVKFELLPNGYLGWFFIVLSFIEALSVYFKRGWWVWRQNIGSSAGSKVELTIGTKGVTYKSGKVNNTIAWGDIDQLQQSDLGVILHMGKQRQYVSKSCLSDDMLAFMVEQHAAAKTS
ncbi:YcxB family protein [Vibrio sp. DNB22_10_4]